MNSNNTQETIDELAVVEARRYVLDPEERQGPVLDAFVIQSASGLDSIMVLICADHRLAPWQAFWAELDLQIRADMPWLQLVERAAALYRAGNPQLYARVIDARSSIDATQ